MAFQLLRSAAMGPIVILLMAPVTVALVTVAFMVVLLFLGLLLLGVFLNAAPRGVFMSWKK